jgi:hypothetical protein
LAVPFGEDREVAKALARWKGKTVIDAMNPLVPLEELDGLPSSAFVAKSFTGAKFVKGFSHLVAATLAADPNRVLVVARQKDDPAPTLDESLPWRIWPNNSDSHPSSWESSTRVARWCTHAAALGVSSSSRICSRRSSNR